jgi:hypothetical protein
MNGYKVFYRGKSAEVQAITSFEAQIAGAKLLKARRSYEVTVVLCEKDSAPVIHDPAQVTP